MHDNAQQLGPTTVPQSIILHDVLLSTIKINIVTNELKGGLLGMLVGNACKEYLNESRTLTCLLVNVIVVSIV